MQSVSNGKLFFFDGDLPETRPIPDLPIERPNFALLFKDPGARVPMGPTSRQHTRDNVSALNTTATGTLKTARENHTLPHADDGFDSGEAVKSAYATGHEGTSTGLQRTLRGGADVDVTDKLTMTWLGQSTAYVTLDKLAILTDPALQDRTMPSVLAPQRIRPPPCTLEELKRVDLVLVSHNHFDHLDPEAVKELGDSCEWVVPSGVGDFLRGLGVTRVTELDWWQETKHTNDRNGTSTEYTITAVPVMHWSARSPTDTNATLWSAFHVRGPSKSFIHLGDTGYSPTLYSAVGRVLGPVDLASIPIGSYEPRWHLHLHHTDPEGAVRMARDLGARRSVGVHWGTWIMSDESYNKPPVDLAKAREKLGVGEEAFCTLPVGRTMVVDEE